MSKWPNIDQFISLAKTLNLSAWISARISKRQSGLTAPQQVAYLLKKHNQSLRGADGRRPQPYAPPVPIIQHWNPSPAALMKAGKQIQATLNSRQPFCKYRSRMDSFETQAGLGRKGLEGLYGPRERTCQMQNDKMCHPRQRLFGLPCTGGLLLRDRAEPYGHFSSLANTSSEQKGQHPRGPNGCTQTRPGRWEVTDVMHEKKLLNDMLMEISNSSY